jgi:ankyrin repeat protein
LFKPNSFIFNTGVCVIVELLLSKGADVNSVSYCGTPLHVAAMENQVAVMKILLDCNADVRFMTCTLISCFHVLIQLTNSMSSTTKLFSSCS